MSELLERERELADLNAMVAEACAGAGRLAVIEAAAGLGKTRLVQAARERGRAAGMQVLAARATELERDFPFALVRQLFGAGLAALDATAHDVLLDGAAGAARGALGLAGDDAGTEASADTFAVLHGLYWLTAALAEQQPLLLAIDDAHWSDAASLDFLHFLLPRLEELPVLLVLACRPDEAGAASTLARIATDAQAQRLTPHALSPAAAGALLAGELKREPEEAFAATCHEVSGGNPFLLHELARTIASHAISPSAEQATRVHELAPERVTRTVLVRLARLSTAAQAVARAVVVLGDDADHALVAELAGLVPDAAVCGADELRTSAILDPGPSLRFIHPLVRTALHADLPAGERAATHVHAAELLQARGASAQQLATHLVATEARGERTTVETLLKAAEQALASGAPRSAIAYLTRALREPAPDDLRAEVLDALITAGIRAADHALFTAILPAVMEQLERDPSLHVRWGTKLSTWMTFNGRADGALPLLERAIEVALADDDVDGAFRLEAQLGTFAQRAVPVTRARMEQYGDRIRPDSATGRLAAAFAAEWHAYDGTAADAVAAAQRALASDGRIFAEQPELFAPGRVVLALILAEKLDVAGRAAERALVLARARSATPELVAALWMAGGVAWARGDLVAAEADLRQALDIALLSGLRLFEFSLRAVLAGALVSRGELDAAEAQLEASGMTGEIPEIVWFALPLFARGLLRGEQGRFAEAADDLLKVERLATRWGMIGMPAAPASICAARAVAALGEHERARAMAEAALARARRWGTPGLRSYALRAWAMTTEGTERIAALEQATKLLERSQGRLARAEALADLGAALRRDGRRADAREPLRAALELARRCGAAGLAKRAYDELAADRRESPPLDPDRRRVAHPQRAASCRDGGERPDEPPDRADAVPHRQDDRDPPRQRLRQARHPLAPGAAGGAARAAGGRDASGRRRLSRRFSAWPRARSRRRRA